MTSRQVVLHADDLGMSHGANAAFAELAALGTCSSGAVMVPCPWFAELATMARTCPTLDIGVHLTLTSEMPGYRWRPLTRPTRAAGLTDEYGFFHSDTATVRTRADLAAVRDELQAQIEAALEAGIDVTHLDDHMGAILAPEFVELSIDLARAHRLPLVLCPSLATYGGMHNLGGADDQRFRRAVARAKAGGLPIFDRIVETDWTRTAPAVAAYKNLIGGLGPGLSFLALHFTKPGEIAAIDPRGHRLRTEEYAVFAQLEFRSWLAEQDIKVIGMRSLRDGLRKAGDGTAANREGTGWTGSASD